MTEQIPLSGPDLTDRERNAVLNVMKGDRLALGPEIQNFEQEFADRVGTDFAVATSSGTAALHILLLSLLEKVPEVPGERPEVITTPYSFVSSTTTILHAGAQPVFVDIEPDTLNIDASRIPAAITENTVGILPVHIFGTPADMEEVNRIAGRNDLFVLEDACEAIGATYQGRTAGTLSDAGTFAFYPNKQMTTGEGGMVVTDRKELATMCRALRNQGRSPDSDWLRHDYAGFNYRMTEMQAALGRIQLDRLDQLLEKRNEVADKYLKRIRKVSGVKPLPEFEDRNRSWFVFVVTLSEDVSRDRVRQFLEEQGIQTGVYFPCIHEQPFFKRMFPETRPSLPVAEDISSRTLALPFFNELEDTQIDRVVDALEQAMAN